MITTYLIGMALTACVTLYMTYGIPPSEFDPRKLATWVLFVVVVIAWPIWIIVAIIDYFNDEGENP